VLKGLQQSPPGDAHPETARTTEGLDDAVPSHTTEERLKSEPDYGWAGVAVEDVLAAGQLRNVYPGREGIQFSPEPSESRVGGMVSLEQGEVIAVEGRRFWRLWLG
jgi:hypothetical protein